jgi:HlyD family secretion protein
VWKWLLGVFIVLAVGCGVGGYFASTSAQGKEWLKKIRGERDAQAVKLEAVLRGDLTRSVSAPGAIDSRTKVKITARVSARITALPFKEGETVQAGAVLVRLEDEDLIAALDEARASLEAEQARLEGTEAMLRQEKTDLARLRTLHESKDRSLSELQTAEAKLAQSEAGRLAALKAIQRLEATVRRAERDLENAVVVSPMDGVITKLNSEVGEVVLGTFQNAGTEIMEIADLTTMLMRAEVDENNIEPIRPGQRATVYINAYPDLKLTGIVDRLKEQNQVSREGKQYYEAEIVLDLSGLKESERLRTGLKANCDIQVETKYDVMKVPSQAVLDRRVEDLPEEVRKAPMIAGKNKSFARVVYRLVDGKAAATPVETGSTDLSSTVILSGLEPGEKIITGPYKVLGTLKDGTALREEEVKADAVPAAPPATPAATAAGAEAAPAPAVETKAGG